MSPFRRFDPGFSRSPLARLEVSFSRLFWRCFSSSLSLQSYSIAMLRSVRFSGPVPDAPTAFLLPQYVLIYPLTDTSTRSGMPSKCLSSVQATSCFLRLIRTIILCPISPSAASVSGIAVLAIEVLYTKLYNDVLFNLHYTTVIVALPRRVLGTVGNRIIRRSLWFGDLPRSLRGFIGSGFLLVIAISR